MKSSSTPESIRDHLGREEGYLAWSRSPSVSLLAVAPLWALYEVLRWNLAPHERNGAEVLVLDKLSLAGPHALQVLQVILGFAVIAAAIRVLREQIPWLRVILVAALEGTLYGLMLGPLTQALTFFLIDRGVLLSIAGEDLVGSIGAGIFEETVFRLVGLTWLALLFGHAARSLSVPTWVGHGVAAILVALAFSGFHHFGVGSEPFDAQVFLFRAVAGVILGALFLARGFCVVVYAHAIYDVNYYLMNPSS